MVGWLVIVKDAKGREIFQLKFHMLLLLLLMTFLIPLMKHDMQKIRN